MQDLLRKIWLTGAGAARRLRAEAGEGVISTAIAVLVMALIGLAMWRLFDAVFTDAGNDIQQNVDDIGS
ncbi:MAG: hypothetical protein AB7H43_11765 [Acidimicrobiia bacterium]